LLVIVFVDVTVIFGTSEIGFVLHNRSLLVVHCDWLLTGFANNEALPHWAICRSLSGEYEKYFNIISNKNQEKWRL